VTNNEDPTSQNESGSDASTDPVPDILETLPQDWVVAKVFKPRLVGGHSVYAKAEVVKSSSINGIPRYKQFLEISFDHSFWVDPIKPVSILEMGTTVILGDITRKDAGWRANFAISYDGIHEQHPVIGVPEDVWKAVVERRKQFKQMKDIGNEQAES
jgi:hypothetical protein